MRITLTSNIADVRAQLTQFSDRRFNAAMATALTRTAVQVRDAVQIEMPRVLDRPTPYTTRQLRYVAAKADRLAAAVGFNVVNVTDQRGATIAFRDLGAGETPAGKYLQPNISGGARRAKRLEVALRALGALPDGWLAVPGQGATLDAYGNVSRGQVLQVLSQLRVQLVAGSNRNMSGDARKQIAAQRRAGGRYYVVPPGKGKVQPGIYQREFIGRSVTPVFIFVRGANYKPRFDFDGVSQRLAAQSLPVEVQRSIAESLQRLQARGT
jgi:hypothetical protein